MLLADDLGYGDLHCYGNDTIMTPNLDRLATNGVMFSSYYATAPVCSPSRAGLLTGRIPSRIGIYEWISHESPVHLKSTEVTIATHLKKSGYQTAFFGKWHLNGKFNSPEQPQPGDHGFDYWFATQNNAYPTHKDPENFVLNGEPTGVIKGYSCQIVANKTLDWLQNNRDEVKPFLIFVAIENIFR
ncbi:MAG: sulfatase-like hydrolase/transferase [Bacteroidota bacterium]